MTRHERLGHAIYAFPFTPEHGGTYGTCLIVETLDCEAWIRRCPRADDAETAKLREHGRVGRGIWAPVFAVLTVPESCIHIISVFMLNNDSNRFRFSYRSLLPSGHFLHSRICQSKTAFFDRSPNRAFLHRVSTIFD